MTTTINTWSTTWIRTPPYDRSGPQAASPSLPNCLRSSTFPRPIRSKENYATRSVIQLHCKFHRPASLLWRTKTNKLRALVGFLLSLTPLSWTLMGWRGAGGSGAASTGWFFFAGGMLMTLGGIGEVRIHLIRPIQFVLTPPTVDPR
jgi:hypothetical protein